MDKIETSDCRHKCPGVGKGFLILESICFFMFVSIFQISAETYLQQKVTLNVENATMLDVIRELRKQTGYKFFFNHNELKKIRDVSAKFKNADIKDVLNAVLAGGDLVYREEKGVIVIVPAKTDEGGKTVRIEGSVTDKNRRPLAGVTVRVKEIPVGTSTDAEGHYKLVIPDAPKKFSIVFSCVGMITKEMPYVGKDTMNAMLEEDVEVLEDVVVTGIFERKKESFTGAATVIKKEELMRYGSRNLLETLKNMDPAFKIVENMDLGSDPNVMPEIQMRGQQSIPNIKGTYKGNPNQPLFILDGFEADITAVFDLDMNRVETIVLLKDAAAKAIYGARAANGVVVIETRRPASGKLKISYRGDLNLTLPDLTGYNLCDAREKYEVDKAHGLYSDPWFWERYLNNIKSDIERGVNTDWLAQPLTTGVGHRHSLYMEGGDESVRYGVDLLYNDVRGVMKNSGRETFTGGFTLSYRYKKLLFRNRFGVTLNRADDSPYGSFYEYAELNPYWSPYDGNGELKKIAGSTGGGGLVGVVRGNPLWNARIGTKNFGKYTGLNNNFYIEWQLLPFLKLTGRLGMSKTQSGREDFYPAAHTKFMGYPEERFFEKGTYDKGEGESSSVRADLTANYSLLTEKHQLFLNAGYTIQQERSENVSFSVMGFPNDRFGFISAGKAYNGDKPLPGTKTISRELGILSMLNYSYDDRYLFDLSYRLNASSRFGKDKRWGRFWSAGIGWNLHKEAFLENADWLRQFKMRMSVGYTGAQNFNPYQALAMFSYYQTQVYDNWIGSYLMGLPNKDLKWQKTGDYNFGFDLNLFGRMSVSYDYYIQNTEDQLLALTIPPSMGFLTRMENLGSTENKGMELKMNLHLLLDTRRDCYVSTFFSIAGNSNKLKKISDVLRNHNDTADENILNGKSNKPQLRFIEGQSMNSIWAVRSLGIDPVTGEEVFLTGDGRTIMEWRAEDQVVCGDTRPKCTGNFGLNMDYKGFSLSLSFYYRLGGQIYNQTLVDRVENAYIGLNVDRRIYDSVWKKPGDKVHFSYTPYKKTKPSSRFVQDLNEVRLSTLNIGYDFKYSSVLKYLSVERLKVNFYMNDVFRASTVRIERGLTYPFARTCSFSLQATF